MIKLDQIRAEKLIHLAQERFKPDLWDSVQSSSAGWPPTLKPRRTSTRRGCASMLRPSWVHLNSEEAMSL